MMNQRYKDHFLKAGAIAKQVRAFGKSLLQPGASYQVILKEINQKIVDLGARAAFPPQMALNEVAAHFLLEPDQDLIFTDQLVKLDVGICYEGAIGDCAVTVDLSGKYSKLIESVEAALLQAEQSVKVGQKVSEIGRVIDETISSFGYKAVKNLSGHGLGLYQVHMPPTIPNYNDHASAIIRPGMTFAIEPFATDGQGLIDEVGVPAIFSLIKLRPVQSTLANALLSKIKPFKSLPFALSDLMSPELSLVEIKKGLLELMKAGIIAGYPPLIEKKRGMVAQAENSVLVDEKGQIFVTTR